MRFQLGSVHRPVSADEASSSSAKWRLSPHMPLPAEALVWEANQQPARRFTSDQVEELSDPLAALNHLVTEAINLSRPDQTWVGFINYDLGREFEKLPIAATDDLHVPLYAFTLHSPDENRPPFAWRVARQPTAIRLGSTFRRDEYVKAVARVIEYIRAGDAFQVNLSQRFTVRQPAPPGVIYDRLCTPVPAAFGALLDYGDFALISNSPELFFRVIPLPDGRRKITTQPIKGTRRLGPGMGQELRDSHKDQAELTMIVDLERNDLGRICEIGSVKVSQDRTIVEFPTLYHAMASIEGILRPEVTFVDILRAMFPGGSITGAAKFERWRLSKNLSRSAAAPTAARSGASRRMGP